MLLNPLSILSADPNYLRRVMHHVSAFAVVSRAQMPGSIMAAEELAGMGLA